MLDRTTVRAGGVIRGRWIFTDTTSSSVPVDACAEDIWDGVWLASTAVPAISGEPGTPEVACSPRVTLAPGVNRFPVTVRTSYPICSRAAGTGGTGTPTCDPATGRPPPLPPGRYTTRFLIRGMPSGFREPSPLIVTLRPSRRLPARDGVIVGTAIPCLGIDASSGSRSWRVRVVLRHGSTVLARRTVDDVWGPARTMVDQPFNITAPAGHYVVVSGASGAVHVVVRRGRTTSVTLPDDCL